MKVFSVLAVLLMALCFAGCSDPYEGRIPVEGHVTFEGKPLEKGFVMFVGNEGYAVASSAITNGHYALSESANRRGIKPGTYGVQIESWIEEPNQFLPNGKLSAGKSLIPDRYRDQKKSGLLAEVDAERAEFDFVVEGK